TGVLATAALSRLWVLLGDVFSPGQAKRLYSLIGAGALLGYTAGSLLAAAVLHAAGPRVLLLASAAGLALAALVLGRYLPPPPPAPPGRPDPAPPLPAPPGARRHRQHRDRHHRRLPLQVHRRGPAQRPRARPLPGRRLRGAAGDGPGRAAVRRADPHSPPGG